MRTGLASRSNWVIDRRPRKHLLALMAACASVVAWTQSPPANADADAAARASPCGDGDEPVLVGRVTRVVDGDTIDVALPSDSIRVRLSGADAPEHDQPWGPQATAALESRVLHREVELVPVEQDRYDRMVAHVCVGPEDVGASLITQGDAWAYRRYLEDPAYCALEGVARAARRGVWSYPPSQWIAP